MADEIGTNVSVCAGCGADMPAAARFCPACGRDSELPLGVGSPKSKETLPPVVPVPPVKPGSTSSRDGGSDATVGRRKVWPLAIAATIAALALGGAGLVLFSDSGPSAAERKAAIATKAEYVQAVACQRSLSDLASSERELGSRLGVGLTYSDYSSKVADVNVSYGEIDFGAMKMNCLGRAVKLESALNEYLKAQRTWDKCFNDPYCETKSIDPQLQRRWAKATELVDAADQMLTSWVSSSRAAMIKAQAKLRE